MSKFVRFEYVNSYKNISNFFLTCRLKKTKHTKLVMLFYLLHRLFREYLKWLRLSYIKRLKGPSISTGAKKKNLRRPSSIARTEKERFFSKNKKNLFFHKKRAYKNRLVLYKQICSLFESVENTKGTFQLLDFNTWDQMRKLVTNRYKFNKVLTKLLYLPLSNSNTLSPLRRVTKRYSLDRRINSLNIERYFSSKLRSSLGTVHDSFRDSMFPELSSQNIDTVYYYFYRTVEFFTMDLVLLDRSESSSLVRLNGISTVTKNYILGLGDVLSFGRYLSSLKLKYPIRKLFLCALLIYSSNLLYMSHFFFLFKNRLYYLYRSSYNSNILPTTFYPYYSDLSGINSIFEKYCSSLVYYIKNKLLIGLTIDKSRFLYKSIIFYTVKKINVNAKHKLYSSGISIYSLIVWSKQVKESVLKNMISKQSLFFSYDPSLVVHFVRLYNSIYKKKSDVCLLGFNALRNIEYLMFQYRYRINNINILNCLTFLNRSSKLCRFSTFFINMSTFYTTTALGCLSKRRKKSTNLLFNFINTNILFHKWCYPSEWLSKTVPGLRLFLSKINDNSSIASNDTDFERSVSWYIFWKQSLYFSNSLSYLTWHKNSRTFFFIYNVSYPILKNSIVDFFFRKEKSHTKDQLSYFFRYR